MELKCLYIKLQKICGFDILKFNVCVCERKRKRDGERKGIETYFRINIS